MKVTEQRGDRAKKNFLVLSQHRNCRHNRMCSNELTSKSWKEQTQTSLMLPVRSLKTEGLKSMDLISVLSRVGEKPDKKACREVLKYY